MAVKIVLALNEALKQKLEPFKGQLIIFCQSRLLRGIFESLKMEVFCLILPRALSITSFT